MAAAPAPAASPDAADGEECDHANDSPHDDVVHNAPPFCFIERAHPSRRRTLCTIPPAPVCWRNNGNQIPIQQPPKEKPPPRNLLRMRRSIFLVPNRRQHTEHFGSLRPKPIICNALSQHLNPTYARRCATILPRTSYSVLLLPTLLQQMSIFQDPVDLIPTRHPHTFRLSVWLAHDLHHPTPTLLACGNGYNNFQEFQPPI